MPRQFGTPAAPPPALILLRAKRIALGLTLQELSSRTNVPINAICQIERGSRIPTERELALLAFVLDVEPPSALMREVSAIAAVVAAPAEREG